VLREKLRHDTERTGWSQAWMAALFARLHVGRLAVGVELRRGCRFARARR
jgi:hypothetical protein